MYTAYKKTDFTNCTSKFFIKKNYIIDPLKEKHNLIMRPVVVLRTGFNCISNLKYFYDSILLTQISRTNAVEEEVCSEKTTVFPN